MVEDKEEGADVAGEAVSAAVRLHEGADPGSMGLPFLKGRSCLQKTAQGRNAACKSSVRAPPPKRRAGKGAYDRAARLHASRTGRPRRKEC